MLASKKIAEGHKAIRISHGRWLYVLMLVFVLAVIGWEESGMQRMLYDGLMYEIAILKSAGESWSVWDGQTVLFGDRGYRCRWLPYGKKAEVCGLDGDSVSDELSRKGFVEMCRAVRQQWNKNSPNQNFIEIGAGVGACAVEMLQSTDAKILVFEPRPQSLFSLTQTLLKNPQYIDRITLFPVALGREASTLEIGGESVPVERLDEVMKFGGAQFMNINPLGYECQVVEGMMGFLTRTQMVHFFVNPKSLQEAQCSSELLVSRIRSLGFKVSRLQGIGRLRTLPSDEQASYDAFAKNRNTLEQK